MFRVSNRLARVKGIRITLDEKQKQIFYSAILTELVLAFGEHNSYYIINGRTTKCQQPEKSAQSYIVVLGAVRNHPIRQIIGERYIPGVRVAVGRIP
jgi:hypothetical protein